VNRIQSVLPACSVWWFFALTLWLPPQSCAARPHRGRSALVVAYFANRGMYRDPPFYLRDLVRNGGASLLSQLNYANASVVGGRCSLSDPKADLGTTYTSENSVSRTGDDPSSPFRGYFHQLKELKRRYPKLRVLISLEGEATSFRQDARPEHRRAFVGSCVDTFLRGHFAPGINEPGIFDGIDLDWEYPEREDAADFRALLMEFRKQMNLVRPGLKLAIAVGDQPEMQPDTNFHDIARLVDQVGIMNYDYVGPWNSTTGLLAPLYRRPDTPEEYSSIEESVAAYRAAGVPSRELLMGVPFYGYQWTEVGPENNGLFQRGKANAKDKPYRAIKGLMSSYVSFRDPVSRAPWLFDGASFWTFDDPISVQYKSRYAADQHLAGIMIWELGDDTAEATLLTVAARSLLQSQDP
jgi:chitinase